MSKDVVRTGTRSRRLALVQVELSIKALVTAHPELAGTIEVVSPDSNGDLNRGQSLEALGGRGFFTADIDSALAEGVVGLATHAVKDLPAETPDGTVLAAMLPRDDARRACHSISQ